MATIDTPSNGAMWTADPHPSPLYLPIYKAYDYPSMFLCSSRKTWLLVWYQTFTIIL